MICPICKLRGRSADSCEEENCAFWCFPLYSTKGMCSIKAYLLRNKGGEKHV